MLFKHVVEHVRLTQRVLATVGVAAIDHQARGYAVFLQSGAGIGDMGLAVVGAAVPTAQHQVSVGVAWCQDDCRMALFIHAEVPMAVSGAAHGIARNRHAAVGAIFETHWQVQPAGHFPVNLRFGGACANGRPAQQVVEVARRNWLQQLSGDR